MSNPNTTSVKGIHNPSDPEWVTNARDHAADYLTRFAFNPGVEQVVKEFDSHFAHITNADERLDYLKKLAATLWDYRKGRERYQITEKDPLDEPDSALGKRIEVGARKADMAVSSGATLKHYSVMAVLGGANMSPYYRLKYLLEQQVACDMLAYLGSEREVLAPEAEITNGYAPKARTEFDLGLGAIHSLIGDNIDDEQAFDVNTSEWQISYMQRKDGLPIYLLSAPPFLGGARANTADTYDFMRRLQQESLNPFKNILFGTNAIYRYAQYFDAVREITLRTGVDVEVIGYEPAYGGIEFKPTQFLQELKSAADAAVRLRNAIQGDEELNEWRAHYYNRFARDESTRPAKN